MVDKQTTIQRIHVSSEREIFITVHDGWSLEEGGQIRRDKESCYLTSSLKEQID